MRLEFERILTRLTVQSATEKLFQAVSQYASEVPIVVVATKKDDLEDMEFSKRRKEQKRLKQPFDEEDCEQHAQEQLNARLEQIREEMMSVEGGRLDALVAVSQGTSNLEHESMLRIQLTEHFPDSDASVSELSKTTSHCFDIDRVRALWISAQVTRIDLKIDLALHEVMRRYRALIRTATATGFVAGAGSIHRRAASHKVCQAIVGCFGLPLVSTDKALEAMKTNVWDKLGFDLAVALAETWNCMGAVGTGQYSRI